MTDVLRQLPLSVPPSTIEVCGHLIAIRPFQVVVWASLGVEESLPIGAPRFPAVIDTGHNHNFSIREQQLREWAGLRNLIQLNYILVNQQEVPLLKANLGSTETVRVHLSYYLSLSRCTFPKGLPFIQAPWHHACHCSECGHCCKTNSASPSTALRAWYPSEANLLKPVLGHTLCRLRSAPLRG